MTDGPGRRSLRLSSLTPERYRLVGELVERLAEVDETELSAALDEACGDDEELRFHVASALGRDDERLSTRAARQAFGEAAREMLAEGEAAEPAVRIEGYRVVRLLGAGGMGRVWLAEQESPKRLVALKTLRAELDNPSLVRRFEREAEALARLQHPAIAQVHEAGVHRLDDGRLQPYFAMEHIEGLPLLEHAEQAGLGVEERLELLARISDGVQHAHARGVVHRDLKPANILVDREGQPKILDFGVARVSDPAVERLTMTTTMGEVLGTLPYMSPEQALGAAGEVGPRSDVYALGVVGYELLSGRRPHDLARSSLHQALHVIGHEEPESLGTLDTRWRGDVDTIIARAMAKESERRYRSAGELATDLRRHLAHEPIFARPASWSYRLTRFVRRHRGLVAATAVVMLTLVVGTVVSTLFAVRARESARLAERRSEEVGRRHHQGLIALATAALREGDVASARRHLESTPESSRDWAWSRLWGRLDQSWLQLELGEPGEGPAHCIFFDDQTIIRLSDRSCQVIDLDTGQVTARHVFEGHTQLLAFWPPTTSFVMKDGDGVFTLDAVSGRRSDWPDAPPWITFGEGAHEPPFFWVRGGHESEQRTTVLNASTRRSTWTAKSGSPLFPLQAPASGSDRKGRYPRFTRDATQLLYPSDAPGIAGVLWDVSTGEAGQTLPGPPGLIDMLEPSLDGRLVVGIGDGGLVMAWELPSGELRWRARVGTSHLHQMVFPEGGRTVLVFDVNGSSTSLDLTTGRVRWRQEGERSWRAIGKLDPRGRSFALSSSNGVLRIIDAQEGQVLRRLVGHSARVGAYYFDESGGTLASTDLAGSLRVWDLHGRSEPDRLRHDGYVYGVDVSPDGRRIASGGWDGTVRLWDAATGAEVVTRKTSSSNGNQGLVAYSPDGSYLATAHDCQVELRDALTGELLQVLPVERGAPDGYCEVMDLDWHPSSTWLGVATNGADYRRWFIEAGQATSSSALDRGFFAAAISPDGSRLAFARERKLELWGAEPLQLVKELPGHEGLIWKVAFSIDGTLLASVSSDRTVRVWNIATGESRTLRGHVDKVHALAWSPDGRLLATGGADDTILLWDVATWEIVAEIREHAEYVYALAWSPDGQRLVSGSGDYSVRIFETTSLSERVRAGRERRRLAAEMQPQVDTLLAEGVPVSEMAVQLDMIDETTRRLVVDLAVARLAGVAGSVPD
ncbi:MAG: protein kinase [Acidobacteriota bacterium]